MSAAREFTDAERAELRAQHARMGATFAGLPFDFVMADPVLRGCLVNTLEAHKRWIAERKARAAREAANFELAP
jgi:hypothetical protein